MDSSRFLLITAWFVVLLLLYQAWQADYGSAKPAEGRAATSATNGAIINGSNDIPNTRTAAAPATPQAAAGSTNAPTAKFIRVNTDNYRLHIDLQGGGIVRAELLNYPVSMKELAQPFVLMDQTDQLLFITQGGLLSSAGAPTHISEYSAELDEYNLQADQEVLEVPLLWSEGSLMVRKIYVLRRGDYEIGVRYEITNEGTGPWTGQSYAQLKRNNPGRSSMLGSYTYTGAVISSPANRYEKISFDNIEKKELQQDISNGWVAMIQHYFVTALIPIDKNANYHYYTKAQADGNFAIGAMTPPITVAPTETKTIQEMMYLGPKLHKVLVNTVDGLELTVDYGSLWVIAKPLFWCLSRFYQMTNNWGWSIILVTVVLKLIFFPLSSASFRSMANMRKVQPRMLAIRERYQNDKARLNQAMVQLYKEEKINPLGGCLPIVVQIPVFFALYKVLLETVEMRHSGFIFWLHDLSSPDPYYVLPVLMGITMFVQQKLSPPPPDPLQAKVMSFMPIMFTGFFFFFQSGLVLYWVVNSTLSIIQQWFITRKLGRPGPQPKSS